MNTSTVRFCDLKKIIIKLWVKEHVLLNIHNREKSFFITFFRYSIQVGLSGL